MDYYTAVPDGAAVFEYTNRVLSACSVVLAHETDGKWAEGVLTDCKGEFMYTLETNASFDSAHFLKGYRGKCANIHGHRWTVRVEIGGDLLETGGSERQMLVDFGDLKKDLNDITENLDHSLIIEDGSLKPKTLEALVDEDFRIIELPFRPTAENFAKYFYELMQDKGYRVVRATVYETPNNCASYSE